MRSPELGRRTFREACHAGIFPLPLEQGVQEDTNPGELVTIALSR